MKVIFECGLCLSEPSVVRAGQHQTTEPAALAGARRHLLEVDGE